jgi:hypothetical protein
MAEQAELPFHFSFSNFRSAAVPQCNCQMLNAKVPAFPRVFMGLVGFQKKK